MNVALAVAKRSHCVRTQVGAVVVTPANRIVATGYNGPPRDLASEKEIGQHALCEWDCPRALQSRALSNYDKCIALHSESNCLLWADRRDIEGGTMYVTRVPCVDCTRLISNSGVKRLVVRNDDEEHLPLAPVKAFLVRCGIEVGEFNVSF